MKSRLGKNTKTTEFVEYKWAGKYFSLKSK